MQMLQIWLWGEMFGTIKSRPFSWSEESADPINHAHIMLLSTLIGELGRIMDGVTALN